MATNIGTWLGIALTAVGFGVTFWQVWIARREARGAREAVLRVERRLASNSALLLLPELLALEELIQTAVDASEGSEVAGLLLRWRHTAGAAAGVLSETEPEIARLLSGSIGAAVLAEGELRARRATRPAVSDFMSVVGAANLEVSRYLGRARAYTGGEDGHGS